MHPSVVVPCFASCQAPFASIPALHPPSHLPRSKANYTPQKHKSPWFKKSLFFRGLTLLEPKPGFLVLRLWRILCCCRHSGIDTLLSELVAVRLSAGSIGGSVIKCMRECVCITACVYMCVCSEVVALGGLRSTRKAVLCRPSGTLTN